jgi:hypothetical protein
MTHDQALRQHLASVLDWRDAHATFDAAVEGVPHAKRGVVPPGLAHSVWQLLEHIRLAQRDILDFCVDPEYVEPVSMDEYWPATPAPPSEAAWDESVAAVRRDRDAMKQLALEREDLFASIPHGSGQTYLREILLVADHAAYHVGQIVLVRRALGVWG